MKKWLTTLFAVVLAAFLLAGCEGGNETKPAESVPDNNGTQAESQDQQDTTEAEPAEKKTITIGICQNTKVEDYDNNGFTRYLEELTGYDIKFDYFATRSDDAKTQLSTRIAGGETLPDILYRFGLSTSIYTEYGREGYLEDLQYYYYDDDDHTIESDKAEIFWTRLHECFSEDDQETALRRMTDQEDGAMYVCPRLETSPVDTMQFQPYINQTWLTKLGLDMPHDVDSFYEVLKAFRTRDPNGNGDPTDEIPLIGIEGGLGGRVLEWIINMFMYYDSNNAWNVDENGQLVKAETTDSYRKALCFINKLYREELLSSSTFNIGGAAMQGLTTPASGIPVVGIFVGHLTLHVEIGNMTLKNYVAMPYWGNAIRTENLYSMDTFITSDCQDVDGAFDFLMQGYKKEVAIRSRYGEENVDWVPADPGTTSYVGTPAEIKVMNEGAFAGNTSTTWNTVAATILVDAEGEQVQFDENAMDEWTLYKRDIFSQLVKNFKEQEAKTVKISSGALIYTEDEKTTTEQVRSNCSNYISQHKTWFCNGTKDPNDDATWAKYLSELDGYGLQTWKTQAQAIYERQKK